MLAQYYLWVVPFLVLAFGARAAIAFQALVTPILLATYLVGRRPALTGDENLVGESVVRYGYIPLLAAITLAMAAWLAVILVRAWQARPAGAPPLLVAPLGDADVRLPAVPRWAVVAAGAVAAVVITVALELAPAYDALYHLIWARDILDGNAPSFDAYLTPTQHPLQLAVAVIVEAVGIAPERVFVALHLFAGFALLYGVGRLAWRLGGAACAAVAVALVLVVPPLANLAVFAYVDIPFLAFAVWAAVLESERAPPRRVMVLLVLAGLLRPEGWLLAASTGWSRRAPPTGPSACGSRRWSRSGLSSGRSWTCSPRAIRCSRATTPRPAPPSSSAKARPARSRG